jgi:hypothetical protein
MSDVKDIEASVGENDFLAFQQTCELFKTLQLQEASSMTACLSSLNFTGRVPYFITTIPPA